MVNIITNDVNKAEAPIRTARSKKTIKAKKKLKENRLVVRKWRMAVREGKEEAPSPLNIRDYMSEEEEDEEEEDVDTAIKKII
jgi:hypothetical protein